MTNTRSPNNESACHLFACCREAKKAYSMVGLPNLPVMGNNVQDWFFDCLNALHNELIAKFVIICWGIWCSRNECVWQGASFDLSLMLRHSLLFLENWSAANTSPIVNQGPRSVVRWEKPQRGRLKMNTDAAINQTKGITGFGWLLRDHDGHFLGAKNLRGQGIYGPKEAEAIGMREALSWLKDTCLGEVDVETDSQLVFKAISGHDFTSAFGLIICDIKELASQINDVDFCFAKRSANRAAHTVAREAVYESDCGEWFDTPPIFLRDCILDDLMN
ncbi:uncharacterized protein LOC116016135 [Ipomoea triloba]|uniref:uncharacterized protein LOC116016135 n=1 Tax=Ipomoea triloba TaxID=35885 RepID=UPI00125D5A4C|nr:uncharacterized protein LOC116016135 [Ipomoea triloba]